MTEASGERSADPLIGTVLDKDYQVVRRIGVGGMSVVYVVEHARLHKLFAAKVLHTELASNPEAMSRFEIEAKAASRLEHENIVNVTDFGVTADSRPYIMMELLKGRTLDERLLETDRPLSLQENVAVIVQVCRALVCAHGDGIVHRDIKPDNVYLTARPGGRFGVKVLDFGIAKVPLTTGRLTKHGQTLGTPHYMSPEACRGDEVDQRADIYSVGILMYQLFTGQLPHHDDNFLKLLQKHVTDPVTPPSQIKPEISSALEAVIMHAIAKDPDDRYASIEDLLREFELALPPGADELLVEQSRVSTPIPGSLTPSRGSLTTPPPGSLTPSPARGSVATPTTTKSGATAPLSLKPSRTPWVIALLVFAGGAGVAIWALTRSTSSPATVATTDPPPAVPADPPAVVPAATTPAAPPAPTTPRNLGHADPSPGVAPIPQPATVDPPRPRVAAMPKQHPIAAKHPDPKPEVIAKADPRTAKPDPTPTKPEDRGVRPIDTKPEPAKPVDPKPEPPRPEPPKPDPVVASDQPKPGSIDITATRAAARSQIGPVLQCYERAKMDDSSLTGSITARITVGPDGSVTGVQITKSTLGSATAEHCISQEISRWRLPRPSGGSSASFSYPFVFE